MVAGGAGGESGSRYSALIINFAGLTPLHSAILALNVAMNPPALCPRMLTSQAQDRLACVQMLLHMGADHTSQVSQAASCSTLPLPRSVALGMTLHFPYALLPRTNIPHLRVYV